MTFDLFAPHHAASPEPAEMLPQRGQKALGQFFTPLWACEELLARHYSGLRAGDVVLDPACGPGPFLLALPQAVQAIGVDIDPLMVEQARRRTGRTVLCGDIANVPLPARLDAVVGNPPFRCEVLDAILERCFPLLETDGSIGLILSAHMLQTPSRTLAYARRYRLEVEMIPRTLFPSLSSPIVFARFIKSLNRVMVGLSLYEMASDIESMPARETLRRHPQTWREVIKDALIDLGGQGTLADIYRAVAPRRQSATIWWKEKIRQQLQMHFRRVDEGCYALAA